ncbi:MAG: GHKL domain-containing protein [Lachnospiraceae bacterium]|nr:GHKL domain-containing protein [Lachnospiraceae bacterium]
MAYLADIFSGYIIVGIDLCVQVYFFLRFLKKRVRPLSLVFCGLLTYVIMRLSYGMACSLNGMVHPFLFSLCSVKAGSLCSLLGGFFSLFLSLACYVGILKYFSPVERENDRYVMFFSLPVFLIFFMVEYILREIYGNTIVTDIRGNVLNARHGQMLALQSLAMASLFCVLLGYKKMEENFRLNREFALLTQEERYLYQYAAEAKVHEEETKSFRHDIKNHMVVLGELLRHNKVEQARHYLGEMEELAAQCSFSFCTNHPLADILVNRKLGLAESRGIDVECSLLLPYPCQVRDIDLCIILSNVLDNAVSGCGRANEVEGYIHVTGKYQGDFIFMEVSNSYDGENRIREGTGLKNIRAVAEKYQGRVKVSAEDRAFTISILLNHLHHPNDIPQQINSFAGENRRNKR